jgi:hypothetical protein
VRSRPHRTAPALPRGRGARTVGVTAAALGTAVAGHALGGAGTPEPAGVVLAALALAAPGWWLARDERGWERLAAAQLAFQLAAHVVFTAVEPGQHAGHGEGAGPGLVLVAHLVSAAVAAAWLRRGEQRARRLATRALALLFALVGALILGTRPRTVAAPPPARRARVPAADTILRHAIVHRGPPLPA